MKPDKWQMRLFEDAPNRMEVKDHQKKKSTRTPKRKGFTSSADVGLETEVEISVAGEFVHGVVKKKSVDVHGSTEFIVQVSEHTKIACRLGELYRRMK